MRTKKYLRAHEKKFTCARKKIYVRTEKNLRAHKKIFTCAQKNIYVRTKILLLAEGDFQIQLLPEIFGALTADIERESLRSGWTKKLLRDS
ncbi:hypothetical protein JT26_07690 [Porphyromonas sp. COT-108 OH1349]|nr:hypothetical protein JT26_07690 [Porphyromonas sp. COT-108 OH1349]